jgi:transposase
MFAVVHRKYDQLSTMMDERLKRRWAACEAMALGYGGISEVARATGLSRATVRKGIAEIQGTMPELTRELEGRIRRPGGGRRPLAESDETLLEDLQALLAEATRGDPVSPLLWTNRSTRALAAALREQGHDVSHMTVDRLLRELGYSLQGNRKTQEGKQSPDRDAQFRWINRKVRAFQRRGQPVVSVDAKQREILGNKGNPGQEWRPSGEPRRVDTHDFRNKTLGHAIPFVVYYLTHNDVWVNVGMDHITAEFAVSASI